MFDLLYFASMNAIILFADYERPWFLKWYVIVPLLLIAGCWQQFEWRRNNPARAEARDKKRAEENAERIRVQDEKQLLDRLRAEKEKDDLLKWKAERDRAKNDSDK